MRGGRCLKGRGDDTREGCCHDGMGGGWHDGRAMPRLEGNGMRAGRWHAAVENAVRGCRVGAATQWMHGRVRPSNSVLAECLNQAPECDA